MRKLLVSAAVAASFALVGAAPAAADQKPTPINQQCGARNMINPHSTEPMLRAMALHTDEHGDAGMFAAVARTRCEPAP